MLNELICYAENKRDEAVIAVIEFIFTHNFCPNCGCDMREVSKHDIHLR